MAAALAAYSELYRAAGDPASAGNGAETDLVDAVLAAFVAGEASLTDVLDVSRASRDVALARLDGLERTLGAERALEAALGRPLPGGDSR